MESGLYHYYLNGNPTGVTESFEIECSPDGSKITNSQRDATPFKTTIAIQTRQINGRFQNCKVNFVKDETKIEAIYEFAERSFYILRKINDEVAQAETLDLPKNCIFFPLMRVFQGQTILQVADYQGVTNVLVPDLQTTTKIEQILQPTFDERSAKLLATNNNLRIFNYLSKHYDENSEFHLDENGLLIYYKFVQNNQNIWEVHL